MKIVLIIVCVIIFVGLLAIDFIVSKNLNSSKKTDQKKDDNSDKSKNKNSN